MSDYPKVDYPTIIEGYVSGDKLRLESLDGSEFIVRPDNLFGYPASIIHDGEAFRLLNCAPLDLFGKTYGVTHLQKYSHSGYLKVAPDCYHRWWFWGLQKQDASGNWIPGSEKGIYFRKPFSWRWDVAGTMIDGELRHWIWTKGYLGGHWD